MFKSNLYMMNLFEFNIVTAERLYFCSTMRKRCDLEEEKGEQLRCVRKHGSIGFDVLLMDSNWSLNK